MIWPLSSKRSGAVGHTMLAGVLAAGLSGCGARQPIDLYWPAPPDTARIKYVGALVSEMDVEGPSFRDVLLGKRAGRRLNQPVGVAVSDDGQRVYVSDRAWDAVFVFDLGAGRFRLIGNDRLTPGAALSSPIGVALDSSENIYVVSSLSDSVKVYDREGEYLREITADGLDHPTGIAIDSERNLLYVTATGRPLKTQAHNVHVFDLQGKLIRVIGRRGGFDGEFNFPTYLALDSKGNLYVTDSGSARVQVFSPEGDFLWKFGERGARLGMFARPKGVALDSFDNIYVVDTHWNAVGIWNQKAQFLLPFGGTGETPGRFQAPGAIAIDRENNIYVCDLLNLRVNMYKLVNTTAEDSVAPSEEDEAQQESSLRPSPERRAGLQRIREWSFATEGKGKGLQLAAHDARKEAQGKEGTKGTVQRDEGWSGTDHPGDRPSRGRLGAESFSTARR